MRQELFRYHWILPYPFADGLMRVTKAGQKMWYSCTTDAGTPSRTNPWQWDWGRKEWQSGSPPAIPDTSTSRRQRLQPGTRAGGPKAPALELVESHIVLRTTVDALRAPAGIDCAVARELLVYLLRFRAKTFPPPNQTPSRQNGLSRYGISCVTQYAVAVTEEPPPPQKEETQLRALTCQPASRALCGAASCVYY